MKNSVAVLLVLINSHALASSNHCLEEYITKIDAIRIVHHKCEKMENVGLFDFKKFYPKMNRYFTVQIWIAGFEKVIETKSRYLRELVDICRAYPRVLSQIEFNGEPEKKIKRFLVDNPNLSNQIDASYKLSPMTDLELVAEMETARKRCEEFQPN